MEAESEEISSQRNKRNMKENSKKLKYVEDKILHINYHIENLEVYLNFKNIYVY